MGAGTLWRVSPMFTHCSTTGSVSIGKLKPAFGSGPPQPLMLHVVVAVLERLKRTRS